MLLPHAITLLNQRHHSAVRQLEACAPQLQQLEKLTEKLNATMRDVKHIGNGRFAFEISLPFFWMEHTAALIALLLDYQYGEPAVWGMDVVSQHNDGHQLVMRPTTRERMAA